MPENGPAGHTGVAPTLISGQQGSVVHYSASVANSATGAWGRSQKVGWTGFPGPTGNEPQLAVADFSIEIWMRRLGGLIGSEGQIFSLSGAPGTSDVAFAIQGFSLFVQADNSDFNDDPDMLDIIVGTGPPNFVDLDNDGIDDNTGTEYWRANVKRNDLFTVPVTTDFEQYVLTWNNSSKDLNIYRNAALETTQNFAPSNVTYDSSVIMDNTSIFKTGAENTDGRRFNGDISLIRIYDEVIDQTTIDANFALGAGTVVPGPKITEVGFVDDTVLVFTSLNGQNYALESTIDETTGVWVKAPYTIEGTGGDITLYDPDGYSTNKTYRLLEVP
jgi:hypothetical protein